MITFAVVSVRVPLSSMPMKPGRSMVLASTRLSAAPPSTWIPNSVLATNSVEVMVVTPDQGPVAVRLDGRAEVVVEAVALDQRVGGRPADEDAPAEVLVQPVPPDDGAEDVGVAVVGDDDAGAPLLLGLGAGGGVALDQGAGDPARAQRDVGRVGGVADVAADDVVAADRGAPRMLVPTSPGRSR
jgi:hypothetical protein